MDNFKRRQQSVRSHRRPPSTDGFFIGGQHSANRRKLGSFSSSEGFTSRARSTTEPRTRVHQPAPSGGGGNQGMRLDLPPLKPSGASKKRKTLAFFGALKKPRMRTVALVFVLAFGSYFIMIGYLKARQVFQGGGGAVALQENIDPARLNGEGDGRVNVLLLGQDEAASLTDTIIIASMDPIHKEAALVSIPRDLYVEREGLGSMKITEVFSRTKSQAIYEQASERQAEFRGYRAIEETVSEITGIPMHYYASIDFDGFRRAIDTVGGVTIDVEEPLYDVMHIDGIGRYILDVNEGQQEFDGLRALSYVRSRKTSPRGDFDRSERQRELLISLKDKVLSAGTLGNPARLNALFNDFADNVQTSFTVEEILRLNDIGSQIDANNIESVELVGEEPNNFIVSSNIGGLSVQVPRAGMSDYSEIQNYIRNTLKDGYLRSEDANVLVLNGTAQPGLATATTDELASYGYNMLAPENGPTNDITETIIIDRTGGNKPYTKRYLEQRFKTFTSTRLPRDITLEDESVDFVILIGRNEIARLEN
ncbi:hypothetical protein BH23PAT2_BH23PAT2_07480 [soil metagenome]